MTNNQPISAREELKRLVIESIHGLPYEEARGKEYGTRYPITIGRVMEALNKRFPLQYCFYVDEICEVEDHTDGKNPVYYQILFHLCDWKPIKENGQEAADDDQTDETIEKLLTIFKND